MFSLAKFIRPKRDFCRLLIGVVSISATWSAVQADDTGGPGEKQAPIVIEHVTVLPMTAQGAVIPDATVVIKNGRIASLAGPAPQDAIRIDGRGKWLIPGLADMHVHLPSDALPRPPRYRTEAPTIFFDTQDIMTPYIANGVTQILNMDAVAASVGQRNLIASGSVLGPHIALAAIINGGQSRGRIANFPADGRQAVRDIKAEGYDFVKVYSDLNAETFKAIVEEARKQRLKTLGHIPDSQDGFAGRIEEAFLPGFDMVAHAEEFAKQSPDFTDADAERFAQIAKANGTWVSPTLVAIRWIASETRSLDEMKASPYLQYVHPLNQSKWIVANRYNKNSTPELIAYFDQMLDFNRRLVREFRKAGVPIVAGTDALTSGVIGGFSLHEELALLVEAGLTNEDALTSATRLPAIWLGVDSDRGTIEVGKRADLVLLGADPLADIANTRKIDGVFLSGQWLDRTKLDAMLDDLSKRNAATRDQYDWNLISRK